MSIYLVSGIKGQDGQIVAELLSKKGHVVIGISHGSGKEEVLGCSKIYYWNWKSELGLHSIIEDIKPDFFINFATYHTPSTGDGKNFNIHKEMFDVNLTGLSMILRSILIKSPKTIFIHASSSQVYSATGPGEIVNENSEKNPSTFYGYTKLSGMSMIDFYRKEHKLNASSAIFFNHESTFRSCEFVSRKISKTVAEIKLGKKEFLRLRNIGAKADISSAYDLVRGLILMAQKCNNTDYIFSSFKSTSVLDLVKFAFEYVDMEWKDFLKYDQDKQTNYVIGNNQFSKNSLGWAPAINVKALVESMVKHDLEFLRSQ